MFASVMESSSYVPFHRLKPRVHLSRAIGFFQLGMFEQARGELSYLPEELPWSENRRALVLEILQKEQDWPGMLECAHGLRMEFPENPQWWVADAYATRRADSIEKARSILLDGLILHYDSAIIRYNLACYACKLGSLGECLDFLKEAVKRDQSLKEVAMEDEDLLLVRAALVKLGWGSVQV